MIICTSAPSSDKKYPKPQHCPKKSQRCSTEDGPLKSERQWRSLKKLSSKLGKTMTLIWESSQKYFYLHQGDVALWSYSRKSPKKSGYWPQEERIRWFQHRKVASWKRYLFTYQRNRLRVKETVIMDSSTLFWRLLIWWLFQWRLAREASWWGRKSQKANWQGTQTKWWKFRVWAFGSRWI